MHGCAFGGQEGGCCGGTGRSGPDNTCRLHPLTADVATSLVNEIGNSAIPPSNFSVPRVPLPSNRGPNERDTEPSPDPEFDTTLLAGVLETRAHVAEGGGDTDQTHDYSAK